MNIVMISIDKLTPYENNPRNNEPAVEVVKKSIQEYGFKVPLVVDKNNVIVAGHTRYLASIELGIEELPCIIADDLTDEQIKAFRLVDNKTHEFAEWDFELLEKELQELSNFDFDMSDFGFEDSLFEEFDPKQVEEDNFDVEAEAEAITEPVTKLGDIWQLGNHRLMCGDSTNQSIIERIMNGNQADLIFTDPPYNVAFNGRSGKFKVIKNDNLSEIEFNNFINKTIEAIKSLKCETYYIWCNWKFYGILQEKLKYKSCIVWAKNNFGLGSGYRHQHEFCLFHGDIDNAITNESDLWHVAKDIKHEHPTQKPVALPVRALNNHSSANNIVDLFGGSGSTLIACEQLNRKCFMVELDPIYCDVIIKRWEELTGQKAKLLNDIEAVAE